MKAKLFLAIMLLTIPFHLCLADKHCKHRPKWKHEQTSQRERSLFLPIINVEEQNNCLLLTFQFALSNAEFTIKESNGNEVMNEQSITLFEGKTMLIPTNEDSYPFSIEISSPTVDIVGEITLEY